MNARQLFVTGRLLTRLGRRAMRGEAAGGGTGAGAAVSASARIVLAEALGRPGIAIGEIAARTGFLQSQVSAAVAQLRGAGLVTTVADPKDARRTLVRPRRTAAATTTASTASAAGTQPLSQSVDAMLVQALTARLGAAGAKHVAEVTRALEIIVNGLGPEGARRGSRRRPRTRRAAQSRVAGGPRT